MSEKKQFAIKNGKIVIEDKKEEKEKKIKKNYSLSSETVERLEELSEKLENNSVSATIEEIVDTIYNLLEEDN